MALAMVIDDLSTRFLASGIRHLRLQVTRCAQATASMRPDFTAAPRMESNMDWPRAGWEFIFGNVRRDTNLINRKITVVYHTVITRFRRVKRRWYYHYPGI